LHVKPGDTIKITLTNKVPAAPASAPSEVVSNSSTKCGSASMTVTSVNMHFHGTNTAPTCHSDEVIHTLVNSGQSFTYDLKIPANEPPGLYWYHPHIHGLAEAAVQGGASGVIEVEGIANIQPAVNGLPERYIVLRDQLVANPPIQTTSTVLPAWDVSVNYVPVPYPNYRPAVIRMQSGGQEFWRVTNASADTFFDLQLIYDGKKQPVQLVALDGVPLGSQDGTRKGIVETQTDVMLPPAGRAEFIMVGPKKNVRNAMLVTRAVNTGPGGDIDPSRPLATIRGELSQKNTPHGILHNGPANAQRFEGLADASTTANRRLYFSEGPVKFFITVEGAKETVFKSTNPPAITTTQGAVEDWTIQNRTSETHAFHIHQIHFLLLAVNGTPVPKDKQQLYDTYPVGFWSGKGPYPSIKVRMDFRGADVGDFVYHCHILEHEDMDMMRPFQIE
jgi:FtsP/CotA-like multicopper oxidase with cupredoxin domain